MPPLARVRVSALEALAARLAAGPTRGADADRAEALAGEVEAERDYPLDWIVFRITGLREGELPGAMVLLMKGPDGAAPSVRGSALLADLSALVERLSAGAAPDERAAPPGAIDAGGLEARWGVSRKTIDRWRRRGLVARRVIGPSRKPMLVFSREAVERFEARHREEIEAAGGYSRIGAGDAARIVARAARYARLGLSLNEAARRLAARTGRSHEGVRQLLMRAERGSERPAFGPAVAPADRRRRLAHRAWRRGLEPSLVAERTGRSRASVVRLVNDHRAEVLRGLALPPCAAPPEGRGERGLRKWLAPAPVRTELGAPGHTDLLALISAARRPEVPIGIVESTRAAAYHALVAGAREFIGAIPAKGGRSTEIDRAETMLRWAARLKAELVRSQLGLMVRTIEAQLDGPIDQLRAADGRALVELGLEAVSHAVDAFDPFGKSGRLAAPTGLAVNRAASRWVREHRAPLDRAARATPRLRAGTAIADWTLRVALWQPALEPDARVRRVALAGGDNLPERERAFLRERFGWAGGPPRTLAEMAGSLGLTPMRVAQRERLAVRTALAAWRAAPPA